MDTKIFCYIEILLFDIHQKLRFDFRYTQKPKLYYNKINIKSLVVHSETASQFFII